MYDIYILVSNLIVYIIVINLMMYKVVTNLMIKTHMIFDFKVLKLLIIIVRHNKVHPGDRPYDIHTCVKAFHAHTGDKFMIDILMTNILVIRLWLLNRILKLQCLNYGY